MELEHDVVWYLVHSSICLVYVSIVLDIPLMTLIKLWRKQSNSNCSLRRLHLVLVQFKS